MFRRLLYVAGVFLATFGCNGTETENPATASNPDSGSVNPDSGSVDAGRDKDATTQTYGSCGYPSADDDAGQRDFGNRSFELCDNLEPSSTCRDGVKQSGEVCFKSMTGAAPFEELSSQTEALAFAVGDLDGDGHVDIAYKSRKSGDDSNKYLVEIYFGDGKGGFNDETVLTKTGWGPNKGLYFSDADGDGTLDIFVAGRDDSDAYACNIYFGNAKRDFNQYISLPKFWISIVADFNGDSIPDLIGPLVEGVDFYAGMYLGLGERRFGTYERFAKSKIEIDMYTVLDMGGDGINDLILRLNGSSDQLAAYRYLNNGTIDVTTTLPPLIFILASDINADNKVDLVGLSPINFNNTIEVLLADDSQEFGSAVDSTVTLASSQARIDSIITLELDNDNKPDLVLTQADPCSKSLDWYPDIPARLRSLTLMMGDGKGKFSQFKCALRVDSPILDLATADVNEDGAADLLILTPLGVQIWLADP